MHISKVKIESIEPNKNNPRFIIDYKFKKLVKSITEFPKMLEVRPIIVDENNVILGGNMRYKACIELGLKEVYIQTFKDLTESEKNEFIIKDNLGFGEWDWDLLGNEWNQQELEDWGLDGFPFEGEDENEVGPEDAFTNDVFTIEILLESEQEHQKLKSELQNRGYKLKE
tara:strand:- start:3514 stop:4023 length:510 start_codon:yes stop_codon:yes gene_type:complete